MAATPTLGSRLEDILARGSLAEGAPPLPGVHHAPRKAQIMAEKRRRLLETQHRGERQARARSREGTSLERSGQPLLQAIKVGLVCASAIMAGVLAAVINHGL